MNIDRENYEMYFLDYHEGRLEPGQVAALLVFLEENPELKEELENFESIMVAPDMSVSFAGKISLKKNNITGFGPINASNYESYFISDTEKLLAPKEQHWLTGFLKRNPDLTQGYKLFINTRLQPDMKIEYPAKAGLKRSILNTRRFYHYTMSAAASIALLFAVYMNSGSKQEPILTARQNTLSTPVSGNKNQTRAIPAKEISTPALTSGTKITGNQVLPNLQPEQALAVLTQNPAERKSVTEIPASFKAQITSRDVVDAEYIFIRQSRNKQGIYTTLYDQVNLAERMQQEQVLSPVVSSPKSILSSGLHKIGSIFTGKEAPVNQNTLNFWTIADLGISGYNLLTDKDWELFTQSNDSGKVVSYALKSNEFEFVRSKNKEKNP